MMAWPSLNAGKLARSGDIVQQEGRMAAIVSACNEAAARRDARHGGAGLGAGLGGLMRADAGADGAVPP